MEQSCIDTADRDRAPNFTLFRCRGLSRKKARFEFRRESCRPDELWMACANDFSNAQSGTRRKLSAVRSTGAAKEESAEKSPDQKGSVVPRILAKSLTRLVAADGFEPPTKGL